MTKNNAKSIYVQGPFFPKELIAVRHSLGQEFSGIQTTPSLLHGERTSCNSDLRKTMGTIAQMLLIPWYSSDLPRASQQSDLKALPHSTSQPSLTQRAADTP